MKGLQNLAHYFNTIDTECLFISEITLAELKYGVENSLKKKENQKVLDDFLTGVRILPIYNSIGIYAKEKARLKKQGLIIDDFDLLIAATAISHNLTLVTNNIKHFERVSGIQIEDWTQTN